MGPATKNEAVIELKESGISVGRACKLCNRSKSAFYYKRHKDDAELINLLQQLAEKHPSYGFRKCFAMLRREGSKANHKKVYRVYRLLGLNLKRRKGKRRLPERIRQPLEQLTAINQVWALDFMSDSLACGGRIRTLNIIDEGSRQGLAIEAASSISALRCIRILEKVIEKSGAKPAMLRSDNGSEFTSLAFTAWCKEQGIKQVFIQKGKPMQNGFMERFNGSFRREILDMYLFNERWQVQELADKWLEHYNGERPHEGLKNKTPNEWAVIHQQQIQNKNSILQQS